MEEYRRGSHSVFRLHVHLVWCTKYRKAILVKDIGYRFRELARQTCSDLGVEILSGVVARDHVHLLVSIPPQVSVSKLGQYNESRSKQPNESLRSILSRACNHSSRCNRTGMG